VHAVEVGAGDLQRALDARADGHHHGVVALGDLLRPGVNAHVDATGKVDPLGLEQRDPAVDHPLLQLRVRHPEAHQPAGRLVALVHGDGVAHLVQLGRRGHSGGP